MEIQSVIISYTITSVSLHMLLKSVLKAVEDLWVAFQEQSESQQCLLPLGRACHEE